MTTREVAETVGILAVVVSLVFVGFQLRQEHVYAQGEQYQARSEMRLANLRAMIESEVALSAIAKRNGFVDTDTLTKEEQAFALLGKEIGLASWDNVHYQYELGLLEDDYWLKARERFKDELRNPDRRAFYENAEQRVSFQALVNELVLEIEE